MKKRADKKKEMGIFTLFFKKNQYFLRFQLEISAFDM